MFAPEAALKDRTSVPMVGSLNGKQVILTSALPGAARSGPGRRPVKHREAAEPGALDVLSSSSWAFLPPGARVPPFHQLPFPPRRWRRFMLSLLLVLESNVLSPLN